MLRITCVTLLLVPLAAHARECKEMEESVNVTTTAPGISVLVSAYPSSSWAHTAVQVNETGIACVPYGKARIDIDNLFNSSELLDGTVTVQNERRSCTPLHQNVSSLGQTALVLDRCTSWSARHLFEYEDGLISDVKSPSKGYERPRVLVALTPPFSIVLIIGLFPFVKGVWFLHKHFQESDLLLRNDERNFGITLCIVGGLLIAGSIVHIALTFGPTCTMAFKMSRCSSSEVPTRIVLQANNPYGRRTLSDQIAIKVNGSKRMGLNDFCYESGKLYTYQTCIPKNTELELIRKCNQNIDCGFLTVHAGDNGPGHITALACNGTEGLCVEACSVSSTKITSQRCFVELKNA